MPRPTSAKKPVLVVGVLTAMTLTAAALLSVGQDHSAPSTPVASSSQPLAQPEMVATKAGQPIDLLGPGGDGGGGASPSSLADEAVEVALDRYSARFGIDDPETELKVARSREHPDGRRTVRMRQVRAGIPVIAGELVVNLDAQNRLLSMNGEAGRVDGLGTKPAVTATTAETTARKASAKGHRAAAGAIKVTAPKLAFYDPALLKPSAEASKLVWQTESKGTGQDGLPFEDLVLVDAGNGDVVLRFDQLDTAQSRRTYDANGGSAIPGTLRCDESDPTCSAGDADEQALHAYAEDVYQYYNTNHGRDSYNGAGAIMSSVAHWFNTGECPNAFWNGSYAVFCNGMAADDVVAHEWTHAVTGAESKLYYYYQSGAINESLSDVWGELIDQGNGAGTDTAGVKWQMGENAAATGVIRDMEDPTIYGDPDKMSSANYYEGAADNGGVHTNSGVNNKAAYLMVDGGAFNGRTVTALGEAKTVAIYYEAQTNLLTSGSGYNDLHDYLYQACQNKVGTNGIVSADCTEVRDATLAVEMDQEPAVNFQPQVTVCPNGADPVATQYFDNMEAVGAWSTATISGTANLWSYVTGYSSSGVKSLYGYTVGTASDSYVNMSAGTTVTTDSFLHFKHAFDFDTDAGTYYDGGFLEYSVGGGAWTDASALFDDGKGYGGTIASGSGNTQQGRSAFVSSSHGYVSTRYDLSSLAGGSVRVRYRVSSNSSTAGPLGWVVDDVGIYRCDLVAPTTTATPSPASPDGSNGWYVSAPTVSLSSSEAGTRQYQRGSTSDAGWLTYYAPFTASEDVHTYWYRSLDNYNNTGDAQSLHLKVDTVDPSMSMLSATADGTDAIDLSWTAATDATSGVDEYQVYGADTGELLVTADAGTTTASITGLSPATTYRYYVKAADIAGNLSSVSNTATDTTDAPADATVPSRPTLTGYQTGSGQVSLFWSAATDAVGFTGYKVYNGDTDALLSTVESTTLTKVYSSIAAGTTKSYYVKGYDAAGNHSAASNEVRITLTAGSSGDGTTNAGAGAAPVTVNPADPVSVTFTDITSSGNTTANYTTTPPVAAPSGYRFQDGLYEIHTTATFTGPVTVSFRYNDSNVTGSESDIKLYHHEGGSWTDVTTYVDTENNIVYGQTNSFSHFGLGFPGLGHTGGSAFRFLLGLVSLLSGLLLLRHLRASRRA